MESSEPLQIARCHGVILYAWILGIHTLQQSLHTASSCGHGTGLTIKHVLKGEGGGGGLWGVADPAVG